MSSSMGGLAPGADRGQVSLEVRSLSKTFSGGLALHNVTFSLESGKVHALLGGNGSGKSTLIKCLAGVHQADPGGELAVGSTVIAADRVTPAWARHNGLRFVHQNSTLFPHMTIEENLALGHGYPTSRGLIRWKSLRRGTRELLERFGIGARPDQEVATVRPADQAMISVARALQDRYTDEGSQVSLLVLDEPTAAMPEEEVEILLGAIKNCAEDGLAIIFVTHRLEEVRVIADTVTVLRDGALATSQPADGLTQADLVEMILGKEFGELARGKHAAKVGEVVARMNDVSAGVLKNVSLDVRSGEVLGLAGLVGSGRSEVLRVLFGDLEPVDGSVEIGGDAVAFRRPSHAMRSGVGYVPEDRSHAVFPNLAVRENLTAPSLSSYVRGPFLDKQKERQEVKASIGRFRIKAPSLEAPISTLSGGNQQKVVLARWLERNPDLLLLDEPTQGVDVGARADAFALIREAAERGLAVVVVSSDFEELADLSDRVLVLTSGRVTAEVGGERLNRRVLSEEVLMGAVSA